MMAYAEHCSEGIGTRTQMCHRTQVFPAGSLLLQRVCIVTVTQNLYLGSLNLAGLAGSGTLHQGSRYT